MQLLLLSVQRGNAEVNRQSGLVITREQGIRCTGKTNNDAEYMVVGRRRVGLILQ